MCVWKLASKLWNAKYQEQQRQSWVRTKLEDVNYWFVNYHIIIKTMCDELGDWDWHVYTDVYKIDD